MAKKKPDPKKPEPKKEKKGEGKTMKCPHCGATMKQGGKCPSCGRKY